MAEQPRVRRLIVSCLYAGSLNRKIPFLRLKGNWLAQAGFPPGIYVKIAVSQGSLTITPDLEKVQELSSEIEELESRLSTLKERKASYGRL